MLNITMWLIAGGIIGWVASIVLGTDAQQGRLLNERIGIVPHGAVVGRHLDYDRHT